MSATPLPKGESPPDHEDDLLADLDERIGGLGGPDALSGDSSRIRPEQIDLILRLHELGARWREQAAKGEQPPRLGRFEIVREVGQGGFATVYEAFDTLLARRVALKVPHPESLLSPSLKRRFVREAEIAASLVHPHLVAIHDVGQAEGVVFIATEFCDGGTLAEWLDAHPGPLPPATAARVVMTLAGALATAHDRGICHRDIKIGRAHV